MVKLHGQGGGVEQNGDKDCVLAERRRGEAPQAILKRVLGNVSSDRFG